MTYDDVQTVLQAELEIQSKKESLQAQLQEELIQVQAQLAELVIPTAPDIALLGQLMGLSELGVSSLSEATFDPATETTIEATDTIAVKDETKPSAKKRGQKKGSVQIQEPVVVDVKPLDSQETTAVSPPLENATLIMERPDMAWLLDGDDAEETSTEAINKLTIEPLPVLEDNSDDDNWLDAFG